MGFFVKFKEIKTDLHLTQNRGQTSVSLVYLSQLAACTHVRRYACVPTFCFKETKNMSVRS